MSRSGNGDKEDAMARESNELTPQKHFDTETQFGLSYGDELDLIDIYEGDQSSVRELFSGGYGDSAKENISCLILCWIEANALIKTLKAFIEAERNRIEMDLWIKAQKGGDAE